VAIERRVVSHLRHGFVAQHFDQLLFYRVSEAHLAIVGAHWQSSPGLVPFTVAERE
jgi:hypothetical protein